MASDITAALNLDKECPSGRVFVVKEINGCEGSFIASCILAHQVKKKCATLLVTFHQLMDHYYNVGLKMGYNLKNQEESGLLKVISPAELFLQTLLAGGSNESFIDDILNTIKDNNNALHKDHGSAGPVCVYFDGLTHLFDLGYSLRDINNFAKRLINVVYECADCYVVFNCTVASKHDDTHVLANLLCHMSYTVVEIENLPTGRSADVSGHLTVKHPGHRFLPDRLHMMQLKPTKYHFRLFDRGVKLFAPGALFGS